MKPALAIAGLFSVLVVLAVATAVALVLSLRDQNSGPKATIVIGAQALPGSDGLIHTGGRYQTTAAKCNFTDHDIVVQSQQFFLESTTNKLITGFARAVTYKPGCVRDVFDIPLQPEVTPGRWKIEGHFEIDGGGGQFSATSNEFEVVP